MRACIRAHTRPRTCYNNHLLWTVQVVGPTSDLMSVAYPLSSVGLPQYLPAVMATVLTQIGTLLSAVPACINVVSGWCLVFGGDQKVQGAELFSAYQV